MIVEARAGYRADGGTLAWRGEADGLPDQHRVDIAFTNPLQADHAAVHIGLEDVIAAEEARGPRQVKLGALLEVLQGAAADAEALRRAVLRVAVELAGDVAQPRRRPPRMLVMVTLSLATMPMDARFNRRVGCESRRCAC